MNPVFDAARSAVTDGQLMGVMTILFFLFFVGYAIWLWLPGNRPHMERMAQAPLEDSTSGVTP